MFGYRGNADWRDMSEYIVHFCRTRDALAAIMSSGTIEGRKAFGWARDYESERDAARDRGEPLHPYPTQKSACLSEVPLDLLDRLIERRGPWGLGFTKTSSSTTAARRSGTSRRTPPSRALLPDCRTH